MTIKELKPIIEKLTDDTAVLVQDNDINEIQSINIQIHSDGKLHLVFSTLE
jgi:hypothetical protein